MIGRRCPKCRSTRIRRGYRPTAWPLRMFGYYSLLCDDCNLLFRGFVVPGTVPRHGGRKKKEPVSGAPEGSKR